MARLIRNGSPRRGFTLIELMVVMTIVSILVALAAPLYQKAVIRSRETVLKQNLTTLRQVLDEYTYDKGKAPQSLEDLVREGYLRQVPVDPMTGSSTSWRVIMEDGATTINTSEPGIYDVRSGSERKSLEGTAYNEW